MAAAVVLALVSTAVALLARQGDDPTPEPTRAGPGTASTTRGAEPADLAGRLAGWIDTELPEDVVLSAPDELRTALVGAGVPEDRMTGDDVAALRIVEGEPAADGVVVARLPGDGGRAVVVVDRHPGGPTPEELDRRRRLAAAVLANPVTGVTGRAAEVLGTAEVDARLLGLLALLVARLDVGIVDFPPAPGQPEEGTPARRVLLGSVGGSGLVPGSAEIERVLGFVAAQHPPFAAHTVEVTEDGVLVGFDYSVAPDAEVTAATR